MNNEDLTKYQKYATAETTYSEDLIVGEGLEALPGNQVDVHYRGWLTNGQVFDESYSRGQAFSFTPGAGQVIAGWDKNITGMKVGGKRLLVIPPIEGYGSRAVSVIPANSVLVFEVELIKVG